MLWNWFGMGKRDDRLLFSFNEGKRRRYVDPIKVEQTLIEHLGDPWYSFVNDMQKPVPKGLVGIRKDEVKKQRRTDRLKVLLAINKAFNVSDFNEDGIGPGIPSGLTELERFALLEAFANFCIVAMEEARPFVNAQSRASPSPPAPPASSGSDSFSQGTISPGKSPSSSSEPSSPVSVDVLDSNDTPVWEPEKVSA